MTKFLVFLALSLMAVAYAAPQPTMINDQAFVDKINAQPGILWTAGMNTRFNNLPLSKMKSLVGVKADSAAMVAALPRVNSSIADSAIPKEFDSETNWPQCAEVTNYIILQSNIKLLPVRLPSSNSLLLPHSPPSLTRNAFSCHTPTS